MILTCPNCSTRYLIGDHALGDEGRNVRCGHCQHTWHAMPESQDAVEESRQAYDGTEPIPEAVRPMPENASLPVIQDSYLALLTRTPKINGAIASLSIFIIILLPVMLSPAAAVNAWPASALLYQTLGVSVNLPGDDLALERVKAHYKQKRRGEGGELTIEGGIINLSDRPERFHRLRAKVMREGDSPEAATFALGSGTLSGESQKSFSHTVDVALTQGASLQVGIMPPWKE